MTFFGSNRMGTASVVSLFWFQMKRKKWSEFSITLCIKSNVLNVDVPKTVTMIVVEIDQNQNDLAKLNLYLGFIKLIQSVWQSGLRYLCV